MAIAVIRATVECDGCGEQFRVDLDPAWGAKPGIFDCVADFVGEALVNGSTWDGDTCSEQAGMQLCPECTEAADAIGPEDHKPTREEILKAIGA